MPEEAVEAVADELLRRRCGVSEVSTPLWTVAEDAAGYAAAGFNTIGIWLHKLERGRMEGPFWMPNQMIASEVLDGAVAAVRSAGLTVSHVVLAGNYTDEALLDDAIAHTLHAIDVAAALDAACLIINPGRLNGLDRSTATERAVSALRRVLQERRAPVRLALEPVIDWQSDFLNTLAQALDIVDAIDHPDVGVYPDTWHLWETGTYDEDIARAGDRIFGFHLNDGRSGDRNREIPGSGEIPLASMVRAAEAAGYRGTYDVEYTTPMAVGPAFAVPYEEILHRCAIGMTNVLLEAGVAADGR